MTDTVERKALTREQLLEGYRVMRMIREFEEHVTGISRPEKSPASFTSTPGRRPSRPASARSFEDRTTSPRPIGGTGTHRQGLRGRRDDGRDLRSRHRALQGQGRVDAHRRPRPGNHGRQRHCRRWPAAGLGAGLSAQVAGTDQVGVAFLGEGATNEGTFSESLNLAAAWSAPCVFVVENNGYAESTGPRSRSTTSSPTARDGYGIPGIRRRDRLLRRA